MARILIIDREESQVRTLTAALKKQGHSIETVTDSATTFSYLRNETPNLIILDLMAAVKGKPAELPEGVRLLAQLYLDFPEIPLVVYSRSRKYKNQFWSWSAAAHLSKKDGTEPVVQVIDRLLSDK
jgi:CheY-like chemotaxis protein